MSSSDSFLMGGLGIVVVVDEGERKKERVRAFSTASECDRGQCAADQNERTQCARGMCVHTLLPVVHIATNEKRLEGVSGVSSKDAAKTHAHVVVHWFAVRPGTAASSSAPFFCASIALRSSTRSAGVHALPRPRLSAVNSPAQFDSLPPGDVIFAGFSALRLPLPGLDSGSSAWSTSHLMPTPDRTSDLTSSSSWSASGVEVGWF